MVSIIREVYQTSGKWLRDRSFEFSDTTGMRASFGRVERWRGGLGTAYPLSGSFVCRCLTSRAVLRFHTPARQTGRADFPHPAFGQGFMRSPTERCAHTSGVGPGPVPRADIHRGSVSTPDPAPCAFDATTAGPVAGHAG